MIHLAYRGGKNWQISEPFTVVIDGNPYQVRQHDLSREPSDGNGTDLASVPTLLWGLVGPYGAHMQAALLHDQLCAEAATDPNGDSLRRQADSLFRRALAEGGVPDFRRWLMWTGVRLGAQFKGLWRSALLGLVLLAGAVGLVALLVRGTCRVASRVTTFVPGGSEGLRCISVPDALTWAVVVALVIALLWWPWGQGSVLIGLLLSPFFLAFLPGYLILWALFHGIDDLGGNAHTKGFARREVALQALNETRGGTATATSATSQPPTRFYGRSVIDAARMGRDAGEIATEVVAHLLSLGEDVKVTVEIEAEHAAGFDAELLRIVAENSGSLDFEIHEFE